MRKANPKRSAACVALATAVAAALPALGGTSTVPSSNSTSLRAGQSVPTISISGSTALKNFLTTGGPTLLGVDSITLGDGAGGTEPEIVYNLPGAAYSVQLASKNFGVNDSVDPTAGNALVHSAMRFEYHESGSAEGVMELVDSQINENAFPDNGVYNPNTTQAVWINQAHFGGAPPSGPFPVAGTPASLNGFNLNFQPSSLPRDPQAQSRVQMAVSDVASSQVFSVAGTANPFARPGSAGYGKGNPLLPATSMETFHGGGGYQYADQSVVNMKAGDANPASDPSHPRSGPSTYGSGAWNTAGIDNLADHTLAQTATFYAANPGTGLEHLNRTDAQWLLSTGRLANGATFNVTTRDMGSGTRNVAANNVGLDPSWAVGVNDDGNGNAPNGGTDQVSIGPGLRFSNKTAGGAGLRPTVQNARMAIGTLSLSDTGVNSNNGASKPLRVLSYRDDADDLQNNSNGANYVNFSEDDSHNSVQIKGDLPSHQFVRPSAQTITNGSYAIWQNETLVTAKVPDATMYTQDVIKGDNGASVSFDASGKDTGAGHDVRDLRDNMLQSVHNASFQQATQHPFNPADALLAAGFVLPDMIMVQKAVDGVGVASVNPIYNADFRNNQFLPNAAPAFSPADPATVTSGSGSTYGNANANNTVVGTTPTDKINITSATDAQGNPTGGNWLFGNFNQNGIRDFSSLKTGESALEALWNTATDHSTSAFVGSAANNSADSSKVNVGSAASLSALKNMMGQDGTTGVTKGDLVVMGDYNGDGVFDGKDLYLTARGAALADARGGDHLTLQKLPDGYQETFGDAVRRGVLVKNAALDYLQQATAGAQFDASGKPLNAAAFIRQSASANPTADPTGVNAFNKFDVNRDGKIDLNDAAIVDHFVGKDYTSLTDQLSATINVDGTLKPGDQKPISLVDVELMDRPIITAAIDDSGTSDFKLIRDALGSKLLAGDTNFDGKVDFGDLVTLARNYGATSGAKWSTGDFDLDGKVDFSDLVSLARDYGQSSPTAAQLAGFSPEAQAAIEAAFAQVPEPATAFILVLASGSLLCRRRRSR